MTSQAALRVGDSEREAAISLLATHFADGRLTQLEHEERMALALNARTGADLNMLFADLPRVGPPTAAAFRRPSRRFAPLRAVQPLIGAAMVLVGVFVVLHLLPVIALVVVVFVVSRSLFGSRRGWHGEAGARGHGHDGVGPAWRW
jgi:Domain of unknown function (DUF1707)